MQIRSADTRCFNLNNYIAIAANWAFDFAYLNTVGFGRKINYAC
jgi:hypothetical protein